jgi:Holliday junction DNA helicase RuvA
MIGKLTGLCDSQGDDWAIIDVGGVGYLVFASARSLSRLPGRGEVARLLIETHVREDHIHLFGFIDRQERDWFRRLLSVQGVGARMALAILSALGPEELLHAIVAEDKKTLTRANGVGPKLAGRIAAELKDKVGALALAPVNGSSAGDGAGGAGSAAQAHALAPNAQDAVSALVNLGYGRGDAFGAVIRAAQTLGKEAPLDALIRAGLKELSS